MAINEVVKDSPFTFQTSFNPIFGVDEDLCDFIEEFTVNSSPRFVDFTELWRKYKLIYIIHGRINQEGLYDILGCIFHRLVDRIQPQIGRSILMRICALYLMYAFYGKQPIRNHVRFRFCPETWKGTLQLITEARDEGHLEVYYIFRKMCAANAFLFCATRQTFYPGAPLFDSPAIAPEHTENTEDISSILNVNSIDTSNTKSRRDLLTQSLPAVKALQTSSTGLNQAIQCLNMSLSRYSEAKRFLTERIRGNNQNDDIEFVKDQQDEEEQEFLDGLNLTTYPDSLNRIEAITMELEKSSDQSFWRSRFVNKNVSVEPNETIERKKVTTHDGISSAPNSPESNVVDLKAGLTILNETNDNTSCQNKDSQDPITAYTRTTVQDSVGNVSMDMDTDDKASIDLGLKRRLLRTPSTWSAELSEQADGVRKFGCRRNRKRPTEPKLLCTRRSVQNKLHMSSDQ